MKHLGKQVEKLKHKTNVGYMGEEKVGELVVNINKTIAPGEKFETYIPLQHGLHFSENYKCVIIDRDYYREKFKEILSKSIKSKNEMYTILDELIEKMIP